MKFFDNFPGTVLLQGSALQGAIDASPPKPILTASLDELNGLFQAKLLDLLSFADDSPTDSIVIQELALCTTYVAELLTNVAQSTPPSWYVIDYLLKSVDSDCPSALIKQGADVSFLICSVFKERTKKRLLSFAYYEKIGSQLYQRYYLASGEKIGQLMNRNFRTMNIAASKCIDGLYV